MNTGNVCEVPGRVLLVRRGQLHPGRRLGRSKSQSVSLFRLNPKKGGSLSHSFEQTTTGAQIRADSVERAISELCG